MKRRSDGDKDQQQQHDLIIGLGERSLRKSYFPQLQEQVAELERFRLLLDQTSDIILAAELPGGQIVEANSALKGLVHCESDPCVHRLADLFSAEDLAEPLDQIINCDDSDCPKRVRLETMLLEGSENQMPVELTLRKAHLDGRDYAVVVARDITERKEAETMRRRLEERINLVQRLDSLGTLAGGIAHDFNNLLMAILGNLSLMEMEIGEDSPAFEQLKDIKFAATSASDLTAQLLGLARGGKYEVLPTNLNEILDNTCTMFSRTRKQLYVNTHLAEGLDTVSVDRSQMEQVLLNLFVNADQAMDGKGELNVSSRNLVLTQEEATPLDLQSGRFVLLQVTDDGRGMDAETTKRIFDPFFTTRHEGRGTGLGLASVHGIVSNHGGAVTVYSELGLGTTFRIYLPICEEAPVELKSVPSEITKGDGRLLIVDDEAMILDVGQKMAETLGYEVLAANSGPEALEILAQGQPVDLVILDMVMPGMSGQETFEVIHDLYPDLKVVLASGYSINGQTQRVLDLGCAGFLQKPFNRAELSSVLQAAMAST